MVKKPLGSSKVGARYQITIPKEARTEFGYNVGDVVIFVKENDKLVLTKNIE
jgi:AbrB family looped-hinge helix DNA binding protein